MDNVKDRPTWQTPPDGPKTPATEINLDAEEAKRLAKRPAPIKVEQGTE